jgi:hypothetical protein
MTLGHNVETSVVFEFARYVHHTWQYGNVWAVGYHGMVSPLRLSVSSACRAAASRLARLI